jgi:hypothetical protein
MKMERAERRMEVMMAGRLAATGSDPTREWVSIKNISGHGARVISGRHWQVQQPVLLAETVGEQHLDAVVVYCQRLAGDRYAVGLKFTSVAGAHESLSEPRTASQLATHSADAA